MDIRKTVTDIISDKLCMEGVDDEAYIRLDLGADSLDIIVLVEEFEKMFGITIPDKDIDQLLTVGDIIEYIETRLKK